MNKHLKSYLRKTYMQTRQGLAPDAVEALNRSLLEQVQAVDWSRFSVVHTFLPILAQNEPDTFRIIAWLENEYPNMQVAVPKVAEPNAGTLMHHILNKDTVLAPSKWGIPEPENAATISPLEVDAVLVPTLVFDLDGHRVGYGRGFYDRFLSACRPDVVKVGLSFFDPVPHIADVLETDVALDCCLSPKQTYWFNKG